MKVCVKCKVERDIESFYKKKNKKSSICKECSKIYYKKYYSENKNKMNEMSKLYSINNKEKISNKKKLYYLGNKEEILNERKEYREKNIEKFKEKDKKYQQENKERINRYNCQYIKNKKESNNLFKLSTSIRNLIWISIKNLGYMKEEETKKIIGCEFEEFKFHIESQFLDEMSWDNYGKWHLDHKIPISWAKNKEDVYRLNHYTNFQPLWAKDNLSKGNRYHQIPQCVAE
jgi:hypothetical protein